MDASHQLQHLRDLQGRLPFLRTLRPDTDRYKLWLGDLVEFVHVAYNPESAEMTRLRELLVAHGQHAAALPEAERARAYVERLVDLTAYLEYLERAVLSRGARADGTQGRAE